MKITKIQRKPNWKFWRIEQWEVTVKLDDGTERTVTVYDNCPDLPSLFTDYVANKVLYGVQFDMDVKRVRAERQRREQMSQMNFYLEKLQALVGTTISETETKST